MSLPPDIVKTRQAMPAPFLGSPPWPAWLDASLAPTNKKSGGGGGNSKNQNLAPTDITLSNFLIEEESPIGTVIGVLDAVDPDPREKFTFMLLDDAGGLFTLDGNQLVVSGALDFETTAVHTTTIQVTDKAGATYQKTFLIEVVDIPGDETDPSIADILLSNAAVQENVATGTEIGIFSAVGADAGQVFSFTLLDDAGGVFSLQGDRLLVAGAIDYEESPEFTIQIEMTDTTGASVVEFMTISVVDVDETVPADALVPDYVLDGLLPNGAGDTAVRWNAAAPLGTATTISFAFLDAVPQYYAQNAPERQDFTSLNAAQRAATHDVFGQIAQFTQIDFVETDVSEAQIVLGMADLSYGVGWAYMPGSTEIAGDVWLDTGFVPNFDMSPGGMAFRRWFTRSGTPWA